MPNPPTSRHALAVAVLLSASAHVAVALIGLPALPSVPSHERLSVELVSLQSATATPASVVHASPQRTKPAPPAPAITDAATLAQAPHTKAEPPAAVDTRPQGSPQSPTAEEPIKAEAATSTATRVAPDRLRDRHQATPLIAPRYDVAYLNNPQPDYPVAARRLGLQGTVIIRTRVNSAGLPEAVSLARSSGVGLLDDAALAAVQKWLFVPAQQGGITVAAWVDVPIQFRLH